MLEELSNMDRITQLQDEIQNACLFVFFSFPLSEPFSENFQN